jgi:hypothetical protein
MTVLPILTADLWTKMNKSVRTYNNLQTHVFVAIQVPPLRHAGLQVAEN